MWVRQASADFARKSVLAHRAAFVRMSLGWRATTGPGDPRHRRTYIGSMPGKVDPGHEEGEVSKKKKPALLLDEVDKLGAETVGE